MCTIIIIIQTGLWWSRRMSSPWGALLQDLYFNNSEKKAGGAVVEEGATDVISKLDYRRWLEVWPISNLMMVPNLRQLIKHREEQWFHSQGTTSSPASKKLVAAEVVGVKTAIVRVLLKMPGKLLNKRMLSSNSLALLIKTKSTRTRASSSSVLIFSARPPTGGQWVT